MDSHHKEVLDDLGNISHDLKDVEDGIKKDKKPIYFIISLLIVLLLIITVIPAYYIKIDPRPSNVPTIDEIIPANYSNVIVNNTLHGITGTSDYLLLVEADNPLIKQSAVKIATQSCDSGKVCQAKAIFEFVQDNIEYVSEKDEYIEMPDEVLITRGADCDGTAVLIASLMQSIGIPTRFVFIPGHVYVQVYLEDALKKYKSEYHWISVDPTCRYCDFGEIPKDNVDVEKVIVT